MSWKKIAPLVFCLATVAHADPDPAALQKQQQDLERRQRREEQKIDQAEEQDRIKVHARERDELARVQRENSTVAAAASASMVAAGSTAGFDTAKLAQAKFNEDEVRNLIQNQVGAEVTILHNRERAALARKYALERAKLEAGQITGDDADKQKDLADKTAALNDKYQEQYDNLAADLATEEARTRFAQTTKINAAERDLTALSTKLVLDQAQKGAKAGFNVAADPEYIKLAAARDQAKGDLETALEEVHAKFNAKHTDIDNAKEDEQAKLNGG